MKNNENKTNLRLLRTSRRYARWLDILECLDSQRFDPSYSAGGPCLLARQYQGYCWEFEYEPAQTLAP